DNHARGHFYGHPKRLERRPESSRRGAAIKTADEAELAIRQRRDDVAQEVAPYHHITVDADKEHVARERDHLISRINFCVRPRRRAGDDNTTFYLRIPM